jgi:hypothetical protein
LFGSLDNLITFSFAHADAENAAVANKPHANALLRIALPPFKTNVLPRLQVDPANCRYLPNPISGFAGFFPVFARPEQEFFTKPCRNR